MVKKKPMKIHIFPANTNGVMKAMNKNNNISKENISAESAFLNLDLIDKTKAACFSGHRNLPNDCRELKISLTSAIKNLIKNGVVYFCAGGALGFDMLAEETVLELQREYPQIKLVLFLPCPQQEQTLKWNDAQKQRYNSIFTQADSVRVISPKYTNGCMLERNRRLVDGSTHLICYLRKKWGGTFYTVKFAEEKNLNIIRL